MKVYFISGLAADNRTFHYIKLPPGFEVVYLNWIKPVNAESLKEYALRLSSGIDTSEPFVLLGLSMGGMLATEIALKHAPILTILISSSSSHRHFPPWFKWAAGLRIQKIVPAKAFKSASLIKRLFTGETKEVKNILRQVIRDSDPAFIKWALNAILNWKNEDMPKGLVQVHGTKDETLPFRYCKANYVIKNGSHMMVMTRPTEINSLLEQLLSPLTS
ncbi:MAG: alpha/beta hydrolase [Ferruginibacter sp.]